MRLLQRLALLAALISMPAAGQMPTFEVAVPKINPNPAADIDFVLSNGRRQPALVSHLEDRPRQVFVLLLGKGKPRLSASTPPRTAEEADCRQPHRREGRTPLASKNPPPYRGPKASVVRLISQRGSLEIRQARGLLPHLPLPPRA